MCVCVCVCTQCAEAAAVVEVEQRVSRTTDRNRLVQCLQLLVTFNIQRRKPEHEEAAGSLMLTLVQQLLPQHTQLSDVWMPHEHFTAAGPGQQTYTDPLRTGRGEEHVFMSVMIHKQRHKRPLQREEVKSDCLHFNLHVLPSTRHNRNTE